MESKTRLTADQIATLFARGRRSGDQRLTRKQTDWLAGVAQREAYRAGCRTEQRTFDGWLLDEQGQSTLISWRLDVLRYGAGIFRLTDVGAMQAQQQADQDAAAAAAASTLEEMDRLIDDAPDAATAAQYLAIRNYFASHNSLAPREPCGA